MSVICNVDTGYTTYRDLVRPKKAQATMCLRMQEYTVIDFRCSCSPGRCLLCIWHHRVFVDICCHQVHHRGICLLRKQQDEHCLLEGQYRHRLGIHRRATRDVLYTISCLTRFSQARHIHAIFWQVYRLEFESYGENIKNRFFKDMDNRTFLSRTKSSRGQLLPKNICEPRQSCKPLC